MSPTQALGRLRTTDLREAVNALLYVLRSGCPCRLLPTDFPLRSIVQRYFALWRDDGLWARLNHHLLIAAREAEGRGASPSAGVIDSQSVKPQKAAARGASTQVRRSRAASVIFSPTPVAYWSRQRFAPPTSRTATAPLRCSRPSATPSPWLRHVFADGAYAGPKLEAALARIGRWTLEIVKRPSDAQGFNVLPRRWGVERTLAWLNRNRRLAIRLRGHDRDRPGLAPHRQRPTPHPTSRKVLKNRNSLWTRL